MLKPLIRSPEGDGASFIIATMLRKLLPQDNVCTAYLQAMQKAGSLVGAFYLELGHQFELSPSLSESVKGEPKQCYSNAARALMEDPDLVYCEGYAMLPGLIPVHHAWLLGPDGRVLDLTWRDDPETLYVGVALSFETVVRFAEDTRYYGVLSEQIPPSFVNRDPREYLHKDWLPAPERMRRFADVVDRTLRKTR